MNFYLRRISRGDIAYRANVPEHLWELILRDGITTNDNYDRDSIGSLTIPKAQAGCTPSTAPCMRVPA